MRRKPLFLAYKGLTIECSIFLYGAGSKEDEPLWYEQLTSSNDSEVKINPLDPNGSLRRDALRQLKTEFEGLALEFGEFKD